MAEFWVSSGHHLTQRDPFHALLVTDELLLALLARPEIVPPPEACDTEKAIYTRLLENPRFMVTKAMIEEMRDVDAQENWHFFIRFRDILLAHKTIEASYLFLIKQKQPLPPLFYNQLVHLILRNALEGTQDPFILRAGEMFFRAQCASFHEDTLMLADHEVIEELERENKNKMHSSPLTAMFGQEASQNLDVMNDANAHEYWSCSDAFNFAFAYGSNPRAREALGKTIEVWYKHMLGLETDVQPLERMDESEWKWFIGLDSEGTKIGNLLWETGGVDSPSHSRLLGIFRLIVKTPNALKKHYEGKPIYLFLGMGEDKIVRLKPQNLLLGLPLKGKE